MTFWDRIGLAAAATSFMGAILLVSGCIVPQFSKVYQDIGISMPVSTQWLLQFSTWIEAVFSLGVSGLVTSLFLIAWTDNKAVAAKLTIPLSIATFVYLLVSVLSLFLPLCGLSEGVG